MDELSIQNDYSPQEVAHDAAGLIAWLIGYHGQEMRKEDKMALETAEKILTGMEK